MVDHAVDLFFGLRSQTPGIGNISEIRGEFGPNFRRPAAIWNIGECSWLQKTAFCGHFSSEKQYSPKFRMLGWGGRIRTSEWRNQKSLGCLDFISDFSRLRRKVSILDQRVIANFPTAKTTAAVSPDVGSFQFSQSPAMPNGLPSFMAMA